MPALRTVSAQYDVHYFAVQAEEDAQFSVTHLLSNHFDEKQGNPTQHNATYGHLKTHLPLRLVCHGVVRVTTAHPHPVQYYGDQQ